jgi:hypothetical protein
MAIVIQEIMQDKIFLDTSGNMQTREVTEEEEGGRSTLPNRRAVTPRRSRARRARDCESPRVAGPILKTEVGVGEAGGRARVPGEPGLPGAPRGLMRDRQRLTRRGRGAALLFGWIFLALSLVGYDPADPPGSAAEPPMPGRTTPAAGRRDPGLGPVRGDRLGVGAGPARPGGAGRCRPPGAGGSPRAGPRLLGFGLLVAVAAAWRNWPRAYLRPVLRRRRRLPRRPGPSPC